MVTVILAFIFLTPRSVFKDSPYHRSSRANEIVVTPDGPSTFIYEVNSSAVQGESDTQTALRHMLEPVAGNVEIIRYKEVRDGAGRVNGYRVWVHR